MLGRRKRQTNNFLILACVIIIISLKAYNVVHVRTASANQTIDYIFYHWCVVLSIYLLILSQSISDHHLRCGVANLEFSHQEIKICSIKIDLINEKSMKLITTLKVKTQCLSVNHKEHVFIGCRCCQYLNHLKSAIN